MMYLGRVYFIDDESHEREIYDVSIFAKTAYEALRILAGWAGKAKYDGERVRLKVCGDDILDVRTEADLENVEPVPYKRVYCPRIWEELLVPADCEVRDE